MAPQRGKKNSSDRKCKRGHYFLTLPKSKRLLPKLPIWPCLMLVTAECKMTQIASPIVHFSHVSDVYLPISKLLLLLILRIRENNDFSRLAPWYKSRKVNISEVYAIRTYIDWLKKEVRIGMDTLYRSRHFLCPLEFGSGWHWRERSDCGSSQSITAVTAHICWQSMPSNAPFKWCVSTLNSAWYTALFHRVH